MPAGVKASSANMLHLLIDNGNCCWLPLACSPTQPFHCTSVIDLYCLLYNVCFISSIPCNGATYNVLIWDPFHRMLGFYVSSDIVGVGHDTRVNIILCVCVFWGGKGGGGWGGTRMLSGHVSCKFFLYLKAWMKFVRREVWMLACGTWFLCACTQNWAWFHLEASAFLLLKEIFIAWIKATNFGAQPEGVRRQFWRCWLFPEFSGEIGSGARLLLCMLDSCMTTFVCITVSYLRLSNAGETSFLDLDRLNIAQKICRATFLNAMVWNEPFEHLEWSENGQKWRTMMKIPYLAQSVIANLNIRKT